MDIATVGLRIDASGAAQTLEQFKSSLQALGSTSDQAEARLSKLANVYSSPAFRDSLRSLLAAKDGQARLNTEISNSTQYLTRLLSITDRHDQVAIQGLRELIAQQRLYLAAVGGTSEQFLQLASVENKLETSQGRLNVHTEHGIEGVGRLRTGFLNLASQAAGTDPILGHLAETLGSFAIGGPVVTGVVIGIGAIILAYKEFTSESRKAREETDHFLESLRKQAQAAKDATVSGAQARAQQARDIEAQAMAAQRRFNETGGGPSWQANLVSERVKKATEDRVLAEQNAARVRQEAEEKVTNAIMASDKAMTDARFAAAEQLQRIDNERAAAKKKADDAEEARLKHLIELENQRLSIGGFNPGAGVSFAIDQRLAADEAARQARAAGSQVADTTVAGMPAGMTHQQREAYEQNARVLHGDFTPAVQKASDNVNKMSDVMKFAAQSIGNTAAQFAIGKFGGGSLGGSVGGGIGQAAAAQLGGFGGTAFGQALFAPILAGIGARLGDAVGAMADSLFNGAAAVKAHAKALADAQKALSLSLDSARVTAGTLSAQQAQINQIHAGFDASRTAANAAFPLPFGASSIEELRKRLAAMGSTAEETRRILEAATKAEAARIPALEEIAKLEAASVAAAEAEFRAKQQQFKEDLQVRLLRAQGHASEADALALQQQQERERADLVKSFGKEIDAQEAATLALLDQVQAAERLRKSIDELNTNVRNAPQLFTLGTYINRFAPPYYPGGGTMSTPFTPSGGPTRPNNNGGMSVDLRGATISLKIPDGMPPEKVGPAFMTFLQGVALKTTGRNAPLAEALDYA